MALSVHDVFETVKTDLTKAVHELEARFGRELPEVHAQVAAIADQAHADVQQIADTAKTDAAADIKDAASS
jgi:hypothetical protein